MGGGRDHWGDGPDHAALAGAAGRGRLHGLVDRRKAKPSDKRVPLAKVEEVLRLYREEYFDLNMRHFHEKLREKHGIQLSYTWVQKALQGAGLVARAAPAGEASAAQRTAAPAGDAAAH